MAGSLSASSVLESGRVPHRSRRHGPPAGAPGDAHRRTPSDMAPRTPRPQPEDASGRSVSGLTAALCAGVLLVGDCTRPWVVVGCGRPPADVPPDVVAAAPEAGLRRWLEASGCGPGRCGAGLLLLAGFEATLVAVLECVPHSGCVGYLGEVPQWFGHLYELDERGDVEAAPERGHALGDREDQVPPGRQEEPGDFTQRNDLSDRRSAALQRLGVLRCCGPCSSRL